MSSISCNRMCATSLGWRHLGNAYGVKAGWFIPLVDKRVGEWQVKLCDPIIRTRGGYDDALYKSTLTLLIYLLYSHTKRIAKHT